MTWYVGCEVVLDVDAELRFGQVAHVARPRPSPGSPCPRYLPSVFALAGDSTMTRERAMGISKMPRLSSPHRDPEPWIAAGQGRQLEHSRTFVRFVEKGPAWG